MNPDISIIIPAYNEEKRIRKSLDTAINYLDSNNIEAELLVVDDGSSDKTVDVAKEFDSVRIIKQPKNMGKGAAVQRGMIESKANIRVFTDADFSTPIYEIHKLIEKLNNGYDIAIGSRAVDYSMIKKHQPWYRELMGKTFNKIVQLLLMRGIVDTQCGFKGFSGDAADNIFPKMQINGFGFDLEALFIGRKLGYKIAEVPVEWYNDENSKVDPIKDSIRMFLDILKVRRLHR